MKEKLIKKFTFIGAIKKFFEKQEYIEVTTPPMVQSPGIEPHLHPFKVLGNNIEEMYLHTSPEFHMKELLSHGLEKIFSISYSFRDEPLSATHRPQFLMLEWYEAKADYHKIMEVSINLINQLSEQFSPNQKMKEAEFIKLTVKEAFIKFSKTNLDEMDSAEKFKNHIQNNFTHIPLPKELLDWDDYFFLLFLNVIEPRFKDIPKLILKDYPASQAALSTLKAEDPSVCERFEIYLNGLEVGNCFNELTDIKIQTERYQNAKAERQKLYDQTMPEPRVLLDSLNRGLPKSSGIAVGVERLLMAITEDAHPFWT